MVYDVDIRLPVPLPPTQSYNVLEFVLRVFIFVLKTAVQQQRFVRRRSQIQLLHALKCPRQTVSKLTLAMNARSRSLSYLRSMSCRLESGGSRDGFSDLVLDSNVHRERDLIWCSPIFICSQTKLSFVMKARGCCPWSQICGRALAFIGCVASKGLVL